MKVALPPMPSALAISRDETELALDNNRVKTRDQRVLSLENHFFYDKLYLSLNSNFPGPHCTIS